PGSPLGSAMPLAGPLTFCAGHVFAVAGMNASILNSAPLKKWLVNMVPVTSVHCEESGGTVRLTSTCLRQVKAGPAWFSFGSAPGFAFERLLTPSQPPYKLSKL